MAWNVHPGGEQRVVVSNLLAPPHSDRMVSWSPPTEISRQIDKGKLKDINITKNYKLQRVTATSGISAHADLYPEVSCL